MVYRGVFGGGGAVRSASQSNAYNRPAIPQSNMQEKGGVYSVRASRNNRKRPSRQERRVARLKAKAARRRLGR